MKTTIFFIVTLLFSSSLLLRAQEKKDSLYYKIEEFSDKRKFTKFVHRFIFRREADSVSVESWEKIPEQEVYDGKTIRNIIVETVDPFGYSKNEERIDAKWYDRVADRIHIDSKPSTIKNYLLFQKGEPYNAQKIYESERILRSMPFINRVNISIEENEDAKSVDILIKVLDSWSLKPSMSYSNGETGFGLTEQNLLGLGHEIDLGYTYNSRDKQSHLYGRYTAYNLYRTFINANISGEKDFFDNERISLSATRDFFSPLTRWAGGFQFEYFKRRVLLPNFTEVFPEVQIKVYRQDLWGGYQFPVFISDGKISRNIALLGRIQNYQYKDRPEEDQLGFFRTSNSFLASAMYNERKFSVQKNIFQYDLPEDIPYGKSFGFTAGALNRDNKAIPYAGISASLGSFINWGYFNVKTEFGRFFNGETQRDAFRLEGTYFTPLQNWKFAQVRHFFSPTWAIGTPRYHYSYHDRINLSSPFEFPAYSGDYIGTEKLVLRYQLQMFIKKTWKNFHFSPYAAAAFGWLSQNGNSLFNSGTHSKFGIGVLINNPYLVFNRIQVSLMYYPKVPMGNDSVFEFNGYRNDNFPMQSFATDVPHFVNFGN